jgi:ferredoxin-NADP reductase
VALRLVVSVRTPDDLYFADEYGAETDLVYTREAPPDAARGPGRLDLDTVAPALRALTDEPPSGAVAGARALTTSSPSAGITGYVCGSAGFAEHASQLLVTAGLPRDAVRVERFGPS